MGAGALDQISFAHHAEAAMQHISGEQLGSALREQIDALQRALAEERGHHVPAHKAA
jgi:hypothetical protein